MDPKSKEDVRRVVTMDEVDSIDPEKEFRLKLNVPFDGSAGLISELRFQPITGKSCWDMPIEGLSKMSEALAAAAVMTGLTDIDMQKLRAIDVANVCRVVGGFMRPFQATS